MPDAIALSLASIQIDENGSMSKSVDGLLVASWSWPRASAGRLLVSQVKLPIAGDAGKVIAGPITDKYSASLKPNEVPLFWETVQSRGPFPQKLGIEITIVEDFSLLAKIMNILVGTAIGMVEPALVGKVFQTLIGNQIDGKYAAVIGSGTVDFSNAVEVSKQPVPSISIPLTVPKEIVIASELPENPLMYPGKKLAANAPNGTVTINVLPA